MAQASIASVVVPKGGIGHEIRAAMVVWEREMIRFRRDPARVASSVVQPLLFLFVLGGGLLSLVQAGTGGVDFKTFLFPGVLSMSVLFSPRSVMDVAVGALTDVFTQTSSSGVGAAANITAVGRSHPHRLAGSA